MLYESAPPIRRLIAWVAVLTASAGCAALRAPPKPAPLRLPVRLTCEMTSSLPEVLTVLSGPADSYKRFPVNELFRSALLELVRAKSDEESPRLASVKAHIDSLSTSYREIGAERKRSPADLRYALTGLAASPGLLPASWGPATAWGYETDVSIPAEIRKGVSITWSAEVHTPGGETVREPFQTDFLEVIVRDRYDQRWAYDYEVPIRGAIGEAVAALDRLLDRVLRVPGNAPATSVVPE